MKKENELNRNLKVVVKSSLVIFIGIMISKVLTYFYRAIIARNFGPEAYGVFSLAVMILGFFTIFSYLGLNDGIVRYISFYRGKNQKSKINYLFKSSLNYLIFSSIIFSIILFFTSNVIAVKLFESIELVRYLKIFSLFFPFLVLSGIFLSVLISFEKAGLNSFLSNILQNVVRVILLLFGIFLGLGTDSIIYSYAITMLFLFIASFFVLKKSIPSLFESFTVSKKEKKDLKKSLLNYSWPIMFMGAAYSLFGWVDSFTLGILMDVSDVGYYNAAFILVTLLGVIPSLFNQLFYPIIVKEYSRKNNYLVINISKQVGKWAISLNLPIFILMFFFPGALINVFFGPEYFVAINALKILAVGSLATSLMPLLFSLFSMKERSKTLLVNIILATVLNLILNIILINKFGINGAAYATTIIWILLNVALLIQVKVFTGFFPMRKNVIKTIIVGAVSTALLFYLISLFEIKLMVALILSSFFVLSYILLIFITGCLDKYDFEIINAFKGKFKGIFKING